MSTIIQHGLTKVNGYTVTVPAAQKKNTVSKAPQYEEKAKSSEYKLSNKAAGYLSQLRKDRSEFDFIVADAGDDRKQLLKQSDKEYTVFYSSAELERMASDPKYAAEKNKQIEAALDHTRKICEQYGYKRASANNEQGNELKKIGVVNTGDKAKMLVFLKQISEKQREIIENGRIAAEKGAMIEKDNREFVMNASVKNTVIEAVSPEELPEKLRNIDWSRIIAEGVGGSINTRA